MSTLEGKSVASSFKDLLQVSNNNIGVDGELRPVSDGEGTQSALSVSTSSVGIAGHFIPDANATYDIGTAERKIRHLYLSDNSLYIGDLRFSNEDVQEVKNVRNGAYATAAQGALAESALQPGNFNFEDVGNKPNTLAGYGIIDAASVTQGEKAEIAYDLSITALQPGSVSFGDITNKPNTIVGYGITDAATIDYVNQSIISSQGTTDWTNITNKPETLAGFGILDAATAAQGDTADSALQPGTVDYNSDIINLPSTLNGYGITDAATDDQGALADSALQPGEAATPAQGVLADTALQPGEAATPAQGSKADTALQPGEAATPAQGALANSALQPGEAATPAQGDRADTALQPGEAATPAQGLLADTALQPGEAATPAQGSKADSAVQPNTSPVLSNLQLTSGYLYGPASLYLDPATLGDNTGEVIILGNLEVRGTTTTLNSTNVTIADKRIELANGAGSNSAADDSGLYIHGSGAQWTYRSGADCWQTNKRIGILTSSPSRALDVRGEGTFMQGGGELLISGTTSENRIFSRVQLTSTSKDLGIYTGSTRRMMVKASGNVGIGVDNPTSKFQVRGADDALLSISGSTGKTVVQSVNNSGSTNTDLGFGLGGNALYINDDGKIGFGTAPSYPFHFKQTGSGLMYARIEGDTPILDLRDTSAFASGSGPMITFNGKHSTGAQTDLASIVTSVDSSGANGNLTIKTATNGTMSDKFSIKADGDVGIGTSIPYSDLHVRGVGSNDGSIRVGGSAASLGMTFEYDQDGSTMSYITANPTYTNTAARLHIRVDGDNNPNQLVLVGNNRVGVNTTSPDYTFDINGSVGIAQNNYLTWHNGSGTAACRIYGDSNNHLRFYNGTTERVRFNSSGYVGIGVTSPSRKLHVGASHIRTDSGYGVEFGSTTRRVYADSSYTYLAASSTVNIKCDSSGRVGIKNRTPSYDLDVAGSVRTSGDFYSGYGTTAGGSINIYNNTTRNILLSRSGSSYFNNNVGIGIQNPSHKLVVANGSNGGIEMNSDGSGTYIQSYNRSGTAGFRNLRIIHGSGSAGTTTFTTAGRVGIGDSTPSYTLDVAGTIRATGDVIAYSDERVKENITTIDNALDIISSIRGVRYNKKGESDTKVGVIAQEVEQVLPEVVSEDDAGMKSVSYGNIVGVLVQAVKDQQNIINDLEARLDRLENK